ncbi:hypothetical protein HZ326_11729 [Fusarium oxysporum f. sp. albedinis]|nr:hypothetical protein HZ326_11729 [Fusarium oxysporum f. sp. albedinis]
MIYRCIRPATFPHKLENQQGITHISVKLKHRATEVDETRSSRLEFLQTFTRNPLSLATALSLVGVPLSQSRTVAILHPSSQLY